MMNSRLNRMWNFSILVFLVCGIFSAFPVLAFEAKIDSFKVKKGKIVLVTQPKEAIVQGQTLPTVKELQVDSDLAVMQNGEAEVVLKKGSKFKILNGKSVELTDGGLRARVTKKIDTAGNDAEKYFRISGPSAVMGVRGTDYYVASNSALGESEVVVFEGKVDLSNIKNPSESKIVPAGHWGGIGGRFGSNISPILALPKGFTAGIQLQLTFN